MRTNIVLNDELVKEAFEYSDAKTKKYYKGREETKISSVCRIT